MCTITFIPKSKHAYLLTHNRDEEAKREKSIEPRKSQIAGRKVLMPVDGRSKGTWIAVNSAGETYCIMNGAFEKHKPDPPYKHSRGLIIPKSMEEKSLEDYYHLTDFEGLEPFTLFRFGASVLEKIVWDGKLKYYGKLDPGVSHLFTSATLYNEKVGKKRKELFQDFLEKRRSVSSQEIIQLHAQKDQPEEYRNFYLQTDQGIQTISITHVAVSSKSIRMIYLDTLKNNRAEAEL